MKRNFLFFGLIALVCAGISFMSCGKDNDNDSDSSTKKASKKKMCECTATVTFMGQTHTETSSGEIESGSCDDYKKDPEFLQAMEAMQPLIDMGATIDMSCREK